MPAVAHRILVEFVHDEITRTGLSRAVLGLSGGIDSALACALAAEALGPQNVLAVCMPYATSSPDSLADAQRVIHQTGVQSETFEITGWSSRCSAGCRPARPSGPATPWRARA